MAVPYTGSSDQVASIVAAYDRVVGEALRNFPSYSDLVFRKPINPTNPGPSMTFEIHKNITPSLTELDERTDPAGFTLQNNSTVTVTPKEIGDWTILTKKLMQDTFELGLDASVARRLSYAAVDARNALIEQALATTTNTIAVIGTTPTAGSTAATGKITADAIRYAVVKLRTSNVATYDGTNYVAYIPSNVANDLRTATDAAGWRVPQNYGFGDLSGAQNGIMAGEIGTFEGVRFIETNVNSTSGTGTSTIYKTYILGAEAVCGFEPEVPHVVTSGKIVDPLDRKTALGWYGRVGYSLYRPEAMWAIYTTSSIN